MNRTTLVIIAIILVAVVAISNVAFAQVYGKYEIADSQGKIIAQGNDWPNGTVNLPAGSTFRYIGRFGTGTDGNRDADTASIFIAFPDGNWKDNVAVKIDQYACRPKKIWRYGEHLDAWPITIRFTDRLLDIGYNFSLMVDKEVFPSEVQSNLVVDNPTVHWQCYYPQFRIQKYSSYVGDYLTAEGNTHTVSITVKKPTRIAIPGIGSSHWIGF